MKGLAGHATFVDVGRTRMTAQRLIQDAFGADDEGADRGDRKMGSAPPHHLGSLWWSRTNADDIKEDMKVKTPTFPVETSFTILWYIFNPVGKTQECSEETDAESQQGVAERCGYTQKPRRAVLDKMQTNGGASLQCCLLWFLKIGRGVGRCHGLENMMGDESAEETVQMQKKGRRNTDWVLHADGTELQGLF